VRSALPLRGAIADHAAGSWLPGPRMPALPTLPGAVNGYLSGDRVWPAEK
jgi:hypothetical protein